MIVCYNPHISNITYFKELLAELECLVVNVDDYVIMGDLNVDIRENTNNIHSFKIQLINNFMSFHNLHQIVQFPTRGNKQLDYIIVKRDLNCLEMKCLPPLETPIMELSLPL